MDKLTQISKYFVIAFLALLLLRGLMVDNVELGTVGVRRSNVSGVVERDLAPGWRLEVAGLHKIIELPSTFLFLDFLKKDALEIRTKDNNIVTLEISVPYRIKPGSAHGIVSAGNHVEDGQGGHRFQRLTRETTVGVLRQHLAELQSSDFYDTDRRIVVADRALELLNEELEPLHVEANAILVRAVYFRAEYETQLMQIQLNAQNKLLDGARKEVANKQQTLDNFEQRTNALAAAREQDWAARLARLDRAYQVGFLTLVPELEVGVIGAGEEGATEGQGGAGEASDGAEGAGAEGPGTEAEGAEPAEGEQGEQAEGAEAEGAEAQDGEGEGGDPAVAALSEAELAELAALADQAVDLEPGAARRSLEQLTPMQRAALQTEAARQLGGEAGDYTDAYLLGIKNIQAETLAYDRRVRAEAEGVAGRLAAEGDALVAAVVGNYEARINQLLDSPAGRAFVAWQAAANVSFAPQLTFQSSDGVPSVLRLRDLAEAFMGE